MNSPAKKQWLTSREFAQLTGVKDRVGRKIVVAALSKRPWRGAVLEIRATGNRRDVALDSLPPELQAKWQSRQPGADLRSQIAEYAAQIEEERRAGQRKYRKRFLNPPITQAEREARSAAFDELPTSLQDEAKKRLKIVQLLHDLAATGMPKMKRLAMAAREAGVKPATVRNWDGACKNLSPLDRCFALARKPPPKRADTISSGEFYVRVRRGYLSLTKPSLKSVYNREARDYREQGLIPPSYDAIKRRINDEPPWLHTLHREGQEAFARLFPPQRRDYFSLDLMEVWCADGRKGDVWVRWEDGSISRPIIVVWEDLRSRMICGWEIGRTESADLIRLAFKAAAENTRALPEAALMDNGRGFAAKLLTGGSPNRFRFQVKEEELPGILPLFGVEPMWALPYSGRSKPVEPMWRIFAEMDKRFPGAYCGNKPDARPEDCDPRKAIPIAQYRAVIRETINHYHETPHRGHAMDGRSPQAIYAELLPTTIVRQPTKEQLRLLLLAAELIHLDPLDHCVRLLGNRYWNEKLSGLPPNVGYTVRFNSERLEDAVSVYRGAQYICDAKLQGRTGFRDQQAAKDHARASRQFRKSLLDRATAMKGMDQAIAWPIPRSAGDSPRFPDPKIVRPLRPELDHQPKKPADNGAEISDEEFWKAWRAGRAQGG